MKKINILTSIATINTIIPLIAIVSCSEKLDDDKSKLGRETIDAIKKIVLKLDPANKNLSTIELAAKITDVSTLNFVTTKDSKISYSSGDVIVTLKAIGDDGTKKVTVIFTIKNTSGVALENNIITKEIIIDNKGAKTIVANFAISTNIKPEIVTENTVLVKDIIVKRANGIVIPPLELLSKEIIVSYKGSDDAKFVTLSIKEAAKFVYFKNWVLVKKGAKLLKGEYKIQIIAKELASHSDSAIGEWIINSKNKWTISSPIVKVYDKNTNIGNDKLFYSIFSKSTAIFYPLTIRKDGETIDIAFDKVEFSIVSVKQGNIDLSKWFNILPLNGDKESQIGWVLSLVGGEDGFKMPEGKIAFVLSAKVSEDEKATPIIIDEFISKIAIEIVVLPNPIKPARDALELLKADLTLKDDLAKFTRSQFNRKFRSEDSWEKFNEIFKKPLAANQFVDVSEYTFNFRESKNDENFKDKVNVVMIITHKKTGILITEKIVLTIIRSKSEIEADKFENQKFNAEAIANRAATHKAIEDAPNQAAKIVALNGFLETPIKFDEENYIYEITSLYKPDREVKLLFTRRLPAYLEVKINTKFKNENKELTASKLRKSIKTIKHSYPLS